MEWWEWIGAVALFIVILKSMTVGSEFNVIEWLKHGSLYTDWYFNRETWWEHLKRGGRHE